VLILDPTYEERAAARTLAARPGSLRGAKVGFVSNGKAGTRPFFDHLERLLVEQWGVAEVVRTTKSNYSAPAEADLIAQAAGWTAMFAGVGD
jgi:hypothetical protein